MARLILGFLLSSLSINQGASVSMVDPVVQRLARVNIFAFGGIGITGVMSEGEKDYRTLASRSSAEADFEDLFAKGDAAAKCYALVGLHKLNRRRFDVLAASLTPAWSRSAISTMQGCLMWPSSIGVVLKSIQAGAYPG